MLRHPRRPIIALKRKRSDHVLELLAAGVIIFIWAYTVYNYSSMPETIPAHYDLQGNADRYGGKENIWQLPAIATGIFIVILVAARHPHLHNYPTTITPDNAKAQYRASAATLRVLNVICAATFMLIILSTGKEQLVVLIFPLLLTLILLPLVYLISLKSDK